MKSHRIGRSTCKPQPLPWETNTAPRTLTRVGDMGVRAMMQPGIRSALVLVVSIAFATTAAQAQPNKSHGGPAVQAAPVPHAAPQPHIAPPISAPRIAPQVPAPPVLPHIPPPPLPPLPPRPPPHF